MPVHAAGARLYSSIKFKHLVKKSGGSSSGHGRATNIALNLTPFVDMMTILVTFLLMVFSADRVLIQQQAGLQLPLAESKAKLESAPVIIVTKSDITYDGRPVSTVEAALAPESGFKLDALSERLEAKAKTIKDEVRDKKGDKAAIEACNQPNVRPKPGHTCPLGLAILQADESTDARLINKIVNTAKAAGFDNLLFAVKNK